MYLSSGSLARRRRAQYEARAGSSGEAEPLTIACRSMCVQENFTRQAPLSRSPNTQRSFLNLLNLPKLDRPGDLGGSDPWKDSESCLHSGSIPMSCVNAR